MATHGKAREATIDALREMKPFKRAGFAMQGVDGAVSSTGRLAQEHVYAYREATVVYTVLSYATPIGWVTDSGEVVIPDDKYSNTTTHHQTLCRVYLGAR